MDYSAITVNEARGRAIAAEYMSAPAYDSTAADAYAAFRDETVGQFQELSRRIRIEVTEDDPYDGSAALFADITGNGRMAVYATASSGPHPWMPDAVNDMFRAVHDFHGHFRTGRGFDRHGEEAAWMRHSRMYSPLARRAMTSETRGQSSAFIFRFGGREFPPQKFTLLSEWVSE